MAGSQIKPWFEIQRPESARTKQDKLLVEQIQVIHKQSRYTYGSPRIHAELKQQGFRCSRKPIVQLMQQEGIATKRKRRFIFTTDSKHHLPVAENNLNQNFVASKPNEKWVSDMDLLRVQHRLHLCVD